MEFLLLIGKSCLNL